METSKIESTGLAKTINVKQAEIQAKALTEWICASRGGTLEMCTGSGKSKVGVDACVDAVELNPNARILIAVPTEKLRDLNWKDEFTKWGQKDLYDKHVVTECYQTIYKWSGEHFDLVVCDEIHNSLTDEYLKFYANNTYDHILGLSATIPVAKRPIISAIAPIVFTYSFEQGVEDGVVSPFEIIVVDHYLNSSAKVIEAGNAKKKWMQTEAERYAYLTRAVDVARWGGNTNAIKFSQLNRMRFMYSLPSKVEPCKALCKRILDEGGRVVLFSNSKDIIDLVTTRGMHSGKTAKQNDLLYEGFNKKEFNIIGSAKKLKEGNNLVDVDSLVMLSYNSSDLDLVQRIGRVVRFVPGKIAKIYIFRTAGTQEEVWFRKMLEAVNLSKIKVSYISSNSLLT